MKLEVAISATSVIVVVETVQYTTPLRNEAQNVLSTADTIVTGATPPGVFINTFVPIVNVELLVVHTSAYPSEEDIANLSVAIFVILIYSALEKLVIIPVELSTTVGVDPLTVANPIYVALLSCAA